MEKKVIYQECSCGAEHAQPHSSIELGPGIIHKLASFVKGLALGSSCVVICDQNTYQAAGERVVDQLEQTGKSVQLLVLTRAATLTADEYALGEIAQAMESKPDFLVGVGSGTISDLVRYTAFIARIPFLLVATAASMDGYASVVAPLLQKGRKKTFMAKEPLAIFADPEVLANAPLHMTVAGIGDLLGKLVAKADWKLGHKLTGEPYCPVIQSQVDQALSLCIREMQQASSLREPAFIGALMEGLVLSGQAITMFGSSRPASGADHHLAHYWEIRGLEEKHVVGLHGQNVGLGTRVILQLYAEVAKRVEQSDEARLQEVFAEIMADLPSVQDYDALLTNAQIRFTPAKLGITKNWIREGLLQAMYVRERYTILRFAASRGWLEELTETIVSDYK